MTVTDAGSLLVKTYSNVNVGTAVMYLITEQKRVPFSDPGFKDLWNIQLQCEGFTPSLASGQGVNRVDS